jgi:hypothetical protein
MSTLHLSSKLRIPHNYGDQLPEKAVSKSPQEVHAVDLGAGWLIAPQSRALSSGRFPKHR